MTKGFVRVNATLYEEMLRKIDLFARKRYEDRSTAIRQLISVGLLEENKREVVQNYMENRITLREAARLLGVDYWEVHNILAEEGVPVSDLTEKEVEGRVREIGKDSF